LEDPKSSQEVLDTKTHKSNANVTKQSKGLGHCYSETIVDKKTNYQKGKSHNSIIPKNRIFIIGFT
jgi:hypothetical protein